jgi:hypothetical protein
MRRLTLASLILPLMLIASPALAFMDCTSAAFAKLIEDKNFICQEVRQQSYSALGRTVVVRSLVDKEDPYAEGFEQEVFKAVETSLAYYSNLNAGRPLKIKDITIVIARNEADSSWEKLGLSVQAQAPNAPTECVVEFYPDNVFGGKTGPLADTQTAIAHEVFHCIQHATWPNLMKQYAPHRWFIEGSAEFASHLVYPHVERVFALNADFANLFRDTALTSLAYENLVFFSWLWQQDQTAMFKLGDAIADTKSQAQERSAILAVVKPDAMSQFVRDYLDGKITAPDGTPMTMDTNIGAVTFSDSETRNLLAVPFAMFALDVTFAAGSYDVTFAEKGNLNWQHRDQAKPSEPWTKGSLKTEDSCDSDATYRFAGMAFDEAMLEVTATRDTTNSKDCTLCQTYSGKDKCLVGTWIIDNTQHRESVGELLDDDGSTWVKVTGRNLIRFEEKGTSDWAYNNFFIAVQEALEGSPAIGVTITGTISQTWSSENGKLATCITTADAGLVMNTANGVGDVINFNEFPRLSTEYYNYRCEGQNTLIIEKATPGQGSFLMRLTRVE